MVHILTVKRYLAFGRRIAPLLGATVAGKGITMAREVVLAVSLGVTAAFDHFLALTTVGLFVTNALYSTCMQHALIRGGRGIKTRRWIAWGAVVTSAAIFPVIAPGFKLGRDDLLPYLVQCFAALFAVRAGELAAKLHRAGRGHLPNLLPVGNAVLVALGAIAGLGPGWLAVLVGVGWAVDWAWIAVALRRDGGGVARTGSSSNISILALLLPAFATWLSVWFDRWAGLTFGAGAVSTVYLVNRFVAGPTEVLSTTLTPYLLSRPDRIAHFRTTWRVAGLVTVLITVSLGIYVGMAVLHDSILVRALAACVPLSILLLATKLLVTVAASHGRSRHLVINVFFQSLVSIGLSVWAVQVKASAVWIAAPIVSTAVALALAAFALRRPVASRNVIEV